jgi:hypothetical protein
MGKMKNNAGIIPSSLGSCKSPPNQSEENLSMYFVIDNFKTESSPVCSLSFFI